MPITVISGLGLDDPSSVVDLGFVEGVVDEDGSTLLMRIMARKERMRARLNSISIPQRRRRIYVWRGFF